MTANHPSKPLGIKSYGSIGHLPGSRRGPGDHGVNDGQARICCEKTRDRHDRVIVTEKLDGSNVGVARIGYEIVPLVRAGYVATTSPFEQHHLFAAWVRARVILFQAVLLDGERLCGEWLALAHGTRYDLAGRSPFALFDLMRVQERAPWDELMSRLDAVTPEEIGIAPMLSDGPPITLKVANRLLGERGHYGAQDPAEGFVYRVERKGAFDFMAKWVYPGKQDGRLLADIGGGEPVWNWQKWE
jgi:hypothetical protein